MDSKRIEPIKIQYGGFKPIYACPICLHKLKKSNTICTHCLVRYGKIRKINWEEN